ncbi:MAG: NAD-dependent epimerase/dehydratase family protein [Candidatus Omnitrophica bacterium]|nr:NAD-dependent epimerase/dehydratase family protein [Candidatus Omnitrophota bacterium]
MAQIIKRRVLVTGANGFIGRHLCLFLKEKNWGIRAAVRIDARDIPGVDDYAKVGDINESTDWTSVLQDVDCVIHLAGRAHVMHEHLRDPASAYHRVNTLGTRQLACQAAQAGVKRFIFVSSAKVNGESGVFTEKDRPRPKGDYALSKLDAEKELITVCGNSAMQEVILRLPLVYGPGVKANFLQLIRLVERGIPLPFKSIHNKRSFIYTGNLCDIMELCLSHPAAAKQLFLAGDGADISTPELISTIAGAFKKQACLLACPVSILRVIGRLTAKADAISRLTDSFCLRTEKFSTLTRWKPRFSVEEGIAKTVGFYKDKKYEKSF